MSTLKISAALLSILLLAGCSGGSTVSDTSTNGDSAVNSEDQTTEVEVTEPETSEFSKVTVVKSAFSYDASLDIAYVHMILENPDKIFAHDYSEAEVAIFDKDGKVITIDEIWIGDIPAGGTIAVNDFLRGDGVPASMELTLTDAVWHPKGTEIQSLDAEQLFTNTSLEYNGYYIEVLADFTAPEDLTASEVLAGVIYFNEAGEIVGGDDKSMEVRAGRVHTFELLDNHPTYTPASFQFFVRPIEN
jgi:hypothetical protein